MKAGLVIGVVRAGKRIFVDITEASDDELGAAFADATPTRVFRWLATLVETIRSHRDK